MLVARASAPEASVALALLSLGLLIPAEPEPEKEPAAGAPVPAVPGDDSVPVAELDEPDMDGLVPEPELICADAYGANAAIHSDNVAAAVIPSRFLFIIDSPFENLLEAISSWAVTIDDGLLT